MVNKMKYKYGEYKNEQFHEYKKRIHNLIHWLLIYAEEKNPNLNNYFEKVQYKLNGLNELINYPSQLVEIMSLVESARIEYNKIDYKHSIYRKIILDIHELIDKIPEGD